MMRASADDRLDCALAAAALGLAVFPVHWPVQSNNGARCSCGSPQCQNVAKHPYARLAPHGLNSAVGDPDAIRRIWRSVPPANIGVRTGDVIVIDIDPRHGGDESLREIERRHGPLPWTPRVLTGGGGEHIYVRGSRDRPVRNSAGAIAPGIDVRGIGGYVIGAGSLHASGRRYEWSVDHHPDDVSLAEAPQWLFVAAGGAPQKPVRTPHQWVMLAAEGAPEGQRITDATSLFGHLLWRDVDAEFALELVRAWNIARCRPPLADAEIVAMAASISQRELLRREGGRGGR